MKRDNKAFTAPALLALAQELGEAIALARVARDMIQQDCAERSHMSRRTLARIEKGDVSVSLSAWLEAMDTVGLTGLLQKPARADNDAIGEARRKQETRRRASKKEGQYDF